MRGHYIRIKASKGIIAAVKFGGIIEIYDSTTLEVLQKLYIKNKQAIDLINIELMELNSVN